MDFEFLSPVSTVVLAHSQLLSRQTIGKYISIHTEKDGLPELDDVQLAIIGVNETRNASVQAMDRPDLNEIRIQLYQLYTGNWGSNIVDLGNIEPGERVEDTYFAVKTVVEYLVKNRIIPIVIGGSQDITYAVYRAFDQLEQMVNLVAVDHRFDFGSSDELISSNSYISKIIVEQPNNLFNFCNLGYQTYFNAQEEIDLMEKLFFDAYRLGEVTGDITLVEPVFRDADVVSIDITAVRASDLGYPSDTYPNGFDGREICAIARYAGISDKVSVFGIFENRNTRMNAQLVAQVLWYFMEGYNFRKKDYPYIGTRSYEKYIVPMEEQELCFYKSDISGRWWIEVPILGEMNNKLKRHTLLPCTHKDYLDACNEVIPERWWKAYKKTAL
ncbi:Arginase family enzyme [Sinomicrobium oceani]|uniref:Arginase family enzyme n=1 Tax=Sinomicrobium oceani TaxID=1150368 RepID=A0A1K1NQ10_9FLAO|nr:formimidoylglutamase [Sinomicrobium oceani]SFW37396.1 Arginase family enzyme [Sinomicrobium oceani]